VLAPERLRELIPRYGSSLFDCQVGKQKPPLPAGKVGVIEYETVSLECDPPREKNLQLQLLTLVLPTSCLDLAGLF
jgi:hypothetical protein